MSNVRVCPTNLLVWENFIYLNPTNKQKRVEEPKRIVIIYQYEHYIYTVKLTRALLVFSSQNQKISYKHYHIIFKSKLILVLKIHSILERKGAKNNKWQNFNLNGYSLFGENLK